MILDGPNMATVLVVGATGLIGSATVKALATDAHFDRVIVLARRAPKTPPPAKVDWRVVDFDDPRAYENLAVDAVLCCLGTTKKQTPDEREYRKIDHDYPVRLAKAAGPRAVYCLVSAVGADAKSRIFYNRLKGETEADVANEGPAALHVFRPSFLVGARGDDRAGEMLGIIGTKALSPFLRGSLSKYRPIEAEVVAAALIRMAKLPTPGVHIYHYAEIV